MATSSGLALRTLASRRAALTAHNPRQIAVPMVTPILFALVLAPALKDALGGLHNSIDYTAFVAVGTVGLLVPLATTFAGLSVIVDRDSGAQRELLAAPIPRPLLVAGNLVVVLGLCALQVVVVIAAAALRGADFHVRAAGVVWFVLAVVLFVVLMYGIAETLAAHGLIRASHTKEMLKVLGNGKVNHPLNVTAHKVSESARAAIEQAGGSVTLIAMRETVKTRRSGKEPPKF